MEKWSDPTCNPPRLLNADKEVSRETRTRLLERALVKYTYIYIYLHVLEGETEAFHVVNQMRANRRSSCSPWRTRMRTSQRSRSPASGQKLYTARFKLASYDL